MADDRLRPVQQKQPVPLSEWKVAKEVSKQSAKISGQTTAVSLVLVLAVVLFASISSDKAEVRPTQAIPTTVTTQPSMEVSILPKPPAFGLPSFQNEEFTEVLAVKIQGEILLEVQSPISGLTPVQLGYEVYDRAQEFILAVTQLGNVDQSTGEDELMVGRKQVIKKMNEIADWFKNSDADPMVENYRKSLWNSYLDNANRTEVSWDNLWWLSNYLTAMGMLSNSPEEYEQTGRLAQAMAEELQRQNEMPVLEPAPLTEPLSEVANTQPMRNFVPQEPISPENAPENSIFELKPLEASLSQNLPGIPANSEGFGLGWSLDSSVRSIQQLWEFLQTGSAGPKENWVVFAVNGVPMGETTVYNVFYFRDDTLQEIWNTLPVECSSFLGKRMSGELTSDGEAARGRIGCLSYLYGFEHAGGQLLAGRHYGTDGRVDYMASVWLGGSRPPWSEGEIFRISSMFDFLKGW